MFNGENNSSADISIYKEMADCLQFIDEAIRGPIVDSSLVAIVLEKYERCEDFLKNCICDEMSVILRDSLHELSATLRWQKERFKSLSDNSQLGIPSSSLFKPINNPENETDKNMNNAKARRQMVLATLVKKRYLCLKDVAGLMDAKRVLEEAMITPLRLPHLFTGARKTWTRILMYGPPGTGKSRLANAISSTIDLKFFSVSSADLMSSWFGESEKMIKELFHCARETVGTSLIFIDEIDSICRRRTSSEDEQVRRVKTELLKQMDEIDNDGLGVSRVFLLSATNCPWELDPAFLRRFQKRIYIPLPDRQSRLELLRIHTKETSSAFTDTDWNILLNKTDGFSGSDIATLAMAALLIPIQELQSNIQWNRSADGVFIPCSVSNQSNVIFECKFDELPSNQVSPREVQLDDFLKALKTSQCTVSSQDLIRFEEFTRQYGQFG